MFKRRVVELSASIARKELVGKNGIESNTREREERRRGRNSRQRALNDENVENRIWLAFGFDGKKRFVTLR